MAEAGPGNTIGVEPTDDDRWIVIDGHRWRRSDPAIPPKLRTELVAELMAARRAVGAADDDDDRRRARARVQDAKVALGERGDPWWAPTPDGSVRRVESTTRALLRHRGAGSSICPSDVARVVGGPGWRSEVDGVREVACRLEDAGEIEITQRHRRARRPLRGAVRLAFPR